MVTKTELTSIIGDCLHGLNRTKEWRMPLWTRARQSSSTWILLQAMSARSQSIFKFILCRMSLKRPATHFRNVCLSRKYSGNFYPSGWDSWNVTTQNNHDWLYECRRRESIKERNVRMRRTSKLGLLPWLCSTIYSAHIFRLLNGLRTPILSWPSDGTMAEESSFTQSSFKCGGSHAWTF